ncbi:proline dehydrogenase [Actinobacteria bacterium YIM 96077]|uniref:Proline dehydrogenase n=1 Tax=Phytoactinopolyspora halophila TaxID=1981511 RepID=A0A329QVV8_9ACTN|nr:proline dehydrogenase family protein [Phytoactinopolyspora halophila]AYY14985.1 proline dehydrogenase [Actinobacteria bacterium YIM 96077]RAW15442.1 proline dehydrogenase [Phytoactinopolyspora halophila]
MISSVSRRALYGLATSSRFESLVKATGYTEDLAYRAAKRYVAGRTLDETVETVRRLAESGFGVCLDLFGEGNDDEEGVRRVVAGYEEAAAALSGTGGDVYLEIVPSNLGLDLGVDVCRRHVERLVELLPTGSRLEVSAEESWRTPRIMDLTLALAGDGAPLVATVQANLKRSPADVERLLEAGVPVRLVKGAYLETSEVAHPWGEPTDTAYLHLAHQVHAGGAGLVLATHDPVIREALLAAVPSAAVEMLLGVREDDARALVTRGHTVRIYAPYGQSWFRYWMRRVAEAQGT